MSKNVQNDNTAAGGEQECSPEEADNGMSAETEEKIMEELLRNWLTRRFRIAQSQRASLEWEKVDVEKAEDSIKSVSRMDTGLTLVEEASEDIGCHKNFQVLEV